MRTLGKLLALSQRLVPERFRQQERTPLERKIRDFKALSPEKFFREYKGESLSFVLAVPKQKAMSRVVRGILSEMKGKILIKRANGRDDGTYAINLETGDIFGMKEIKPGGLQNAFALSARQGAPTGTMRINKEIEKNHEPAPVIGILGRDTFKSLQVASHDFNENVGIHRPMNTSHAAIYLGAREQGHLEDIGRKQIKIAVTDRYEPILRAYLEQLRLKAGRDDFVMPELISCDGGTEAYLDSHDDINIICDLFDSGTSALNAGIQHVQLLERSQANVLSRKDLADNFRPQAAKIDDFCDMLDEATERHFRKTHPHLFQHEKGYEPGPEEIITIEELFMAMEADIEKAEKKLRKKAGQSFYHVPALAA